LDLSYPILIFLFDLIGDVLFTDIDDVSILGDLLLFDLSFKISGETSERHEFSGSVGVLVSTEFTEARDSGVPGVLTVLQSLTGSFPSSFNFFHFVTDINEGDVISAEVVVAHVYCDCSKAAHNNDC